MDINIADRDNSCCYWVSVTTRDPGTWLRALYPQSAMFLVAMTEQVPRNLTTIGSWKVL